MIVKLVLCCAVNIGKCHKPNCVLFPYSIINPSQKGLHLSIYSSILNTAYPVYGQRVLGPILKRGPYLELAAGQLQGKYRDKHSHHHQVGCVPLHTSQGVHHVHQWPSKESSPVKIIDNSTNSCWRALILFMLFKDKSHRNPIGSILRHLATPHFGSQSK